MMNGDALPAVQLCTLHMIGKLFHLEQNQIAFSAVVYLLRIVHMPVPIYRATKIEGLATRTRFPLAIGPWRWCVSG
jgi:hypothetical protein